MYEQKLVAVHEVVGAWLQRATAGGAPGGGAGGCDCGVCGSGCGGSCGSGGDCGGGKSGGGGSGGGGGSSCSSDPGSLPVSGGGGGGGEAVAVVTAPGGGSSQQQVGIGAASGCWFSLCTVVPLPVLFCQIPKQGVAVPHKRSRAHFCRQLPRRLC